jgi:hypothetical protein
VQHEIVQIINRRIIREMEASNSAGNFPVDSSFPPGLPRSTQGTGRTPRRLLRPEHRSNTRPRDSWVVQSSTALGRNVSRAAGLIVSCGCNISKDTIEDRHGNSNVCALRDATDGADDRRGAFKNEDVNGPRSSQ